MIAFILFFILFFLSFFFLTIYSIRIVTWCEMEICKSEKISSILYTFFYIMAPSVPNIYLKG